MFDSDPMDPPVTAAYARALSPQRVRTTLGLPPPAAVFARLWAIGVLGLAGIGFQGCQTAQESSTTGTTAKSSAAPNSSASGLGPRRLEANTGGKAASATPSTTPAAPRGDPTASLLESGSEVDGNVGADRVSPRARTSAQRNTATTAGTAAGATSTGAGSDSERPASQNPDEQHPVWAVMLASFTEGEHRANADTARAQIVQRFPALKGAYVRTTSRGSVVLYGRFDGIQDPRAKEELKRIKDIGEGTPKPFARAMLTRMSASPNDAPPAPNDLRTVRQQHPKGTLYTLQVAAWSSLGTKELSMSQIKRSAESYAQQLRTQGYEAYFFHDFDTQTSTVTVGVFGPDSYDSRSTLYAPEVEAMMRKFPKSLLNGEEVLMPVDSKRPGSKLIPQSPRLVEIPR